VKPVGELAFTTVAIGDHKVAGIVVITEELVRLSTPSAEETVRRDLIAQCARYIDTQFLTTTVTAGANNPASITASVASPPASGTDADALYFDMNAALATFDNADLGTNNVYIVTTPALARGISTLRNALGQFEFSGVNMMGGTLMGLPVIVSSAVQSGHIILIKADEIFLADEGRVRLDASNQATLSMTGEATATFSLWQRNCIGLRAEQFITWAKRRADSVALIDTAAYGPTSGS
jgi:HK97 family phage major capsid protein